MKNLLLATMLLVPQLAMAQIFKSTDEDGNVTFSDKPPTNGASEEIKLQVTNSAPAPQVSEAPPPKTAPDDAAAVSYDLTITAPANETTFPMGPGNFTVSASVEPALEEGALLQLLIDGTPSGTPQSGRQWALTNVFRGAHDITVSVVDNNGDQLAESEAVRVYVLRPSTNFDNRKKRPRPTPR